MNDDHDYVVRGIAFRIAKNAHSGQFRRDGLTPYINHPISVAERVQHFGYKYVCVAYLHDVLEDTSVTADELAREGIPDDIIEAVQLLTKHDDQSYDEYLFLINQNELARRVKIADMLTNLADNPTKNQIKKYAKGLLFLID